MKKTKLVAGILVGVILIGGATACGKTDATLSSSTLTSGTTSQMPTTADQTTSTQIATGETTALSNQTTVYPLTMTDKFGQEIVIKEEPQKVISYSPELVEIMYAIDAGDKLIGRSQYCNYPQEVMDVPDMGDLFNLNMEHVVEAKPDLVLLSSMAGEEVVKSLQDKGIQVLALDADTSVDGVYEYIKDIGTVLNQNQAANELVSSMKDKVAEIVATVDGLDKPTAYFVVSAGEYDSAATGDTFIGQLMELAGSVNVAADGKDWYYTIEKLLEKDPEILLCSANIGMKETLLSTPGYKDLTAVKSGRVYEVDEDVFFRQGPRMVEAVEILARIFHPDAFPAT